MRHVQEPFTMRTHGKLMDENNEMSIAIKLHYFDLSNETNKEAIDKAKSHHKKPTWQDVCELLNKNISALDEQRYNPIKY